MLACSLCNKIGVDFYITNSSVCKECVKLRKRNNYKNNKEKRTAYQRQYNVANKEKLYPKAKERIRKYRKTIKGSIDSKMSHAIRQALLVNGVRKNKRTWESLTGYSINQLKEHLEKQFQPGMTWSDFIDGKIHIDHIRPKSIFKYDSYDSNNFKDCWSLSNLQPLWAKDNLAKGSKE